MKKRKPVGWVSRVSWNPAAFHESGDGKIPGTMRLLIES